MRYISTRGQAPPVSFLDAVLAGMAPDGGLYVPESWPDLGSDGFRRRAASDHFTTVAQHVARAFAGDDEIVAKTWFNAAAFSRAVAPLVQVGNSDWVLELFHGPSLSFKDIAMQFIGPLLNQALAHRGARLSVVCATSGDTGGAAVEALRNVERVDVFVLLPKGRVSSVQRLFMTASGSPNIHAVEVEGDFDACQAIVKAMFADKDFAQRAALSGVNSINWARIVAQSAYFHVAANTLSAWAPVQFSIPTGNFGDAYSGYVAKRTGAPVGNIVLAVNSNDMLARALASGCYERAASSAATISPAMDIQVASNFERILFEALDRDGEAVARLYDQLAQSGSFAIPHDALHRLRRDFVATSLSDAETIATIAEWWSDGRGYLACPHTAVGLGAWSKLEDWPGAPRVTLATAHPAKFPDTVDRATGVRPQLPAKCADLFDRAEKFDTLGADVEALKAYIRERSRAWV